MRAVQCFLEDDDKEENGIQETESPDGKMISGDARLHAPTLDEQPLLEELSPVLAVTESGWPTCASIVDWLKKLADSAAEVFVV